MLNIQHCICTSHLTQGTCQSSKIAANDNNTQKNRAVHEHKLLSESVMKREKTKGMMMMLYLKKGKQKRRE